MEGKLIRDFLSKKGFIKADIARFIKVSPQHLNNILNSPDITTSNVEKISKAIGVNIFSLYDYETHKLKTENLREVTKSHRITSQDKSIKQNGKPIIEKKFNQQYEYKITGYYYPDVSASAGLQTILDNTELNKLPVSIPNFGNDVHFVNVFGDSMYPKYCSGEIIGIKEVEFDYLNFGHAYVIIMNNSEVYLKYVKKGKDDEHVLLVSENNHYEPREFCLSLIRSFFMVKGIISKTSM